MKSHILQNIYWFEYGYYYCWLLRNMDWNGHHNVLQQEQHSQIHTCNIITHFYIMRVVYAENKLFFEGVACKIFQYKFKNNDK